VKIAQDEILGKRAKPGPRPEGSRRTPRTPQQSDKRCSTRLVNVPYFAFLDAINEAIPLRRPNSRRVFTAAPTRNEMELPEFWKTTRLSGDVATMTGINR
jgi:hypothetical protein